MVSESVPLTSDSAEVINQPLKSIVKLFAHAASQGIDRLGDSDFGVSAYFEGALSQPGLLEKVRSHTDGVLRVSVCAQRLTERPHFRFLAFTLPTATWT